MATMLKRAASSVMVLSSRHAQQHVSMHAASERCALAVVSLVAFTAFLAAPISGSLADRAFLEDGSVIGGCAQDLLRTRFSSAVGGDDYLAALALESELLLLCNERQELLAAALESESRLRELQTELTTTITTAEEEPPEQIAAQPARRSLLDVISLPVATADVRAEPESKPEQPVVTWFSITGTRDDLRAGLSDGKKIWWVREGDSLPDGVEIHRIRSQPPGVSIAMPDQAKPVEISWMPPPRNSVVGHAN